MLRGLAVQVPFLVIVVALLAILYRTGTLTRTSFYAWAIGLIGAMAVASTVYTTLGMRRFLAARAAAEGRQ